jgi:ribosomal protein S18 acetylase RimI-like enzyme
VSLADRVDAVHAEFRRLSALALGGEVSTDDGLLLWAGPNPAPLVVNGVIRRDPNVSAADAVGAAVDFFGTRARGYTIFCRRDADPDIVDLCRARDCRELAVGGLPELVIHEPAPVPALAAGVDVREVSTDQDHADYVDVFAAAYAQLGASRDVVEGVMPPLEMVQRDEVGAFVVRLEGVPAAVAMSVVIDGVSDIHWVGTMPFAGRRGLGELATAKAVEHGFAHGADVSALQASPMGDQLYRRMGFVELYRYEEFVVAAT